MACQVKKECFLVNAPAGSGKTTKIKAMIKEHTSVHPKDNILCITYTNRAADELLKDISSKNVFISTIHSFLNKFISPHFSSKEVLDLYCDQYAEEIQRRIDSHDPNIIESRNKYIEKLSDKELTPEKIRQNLTKLYYNESSFNSLFNGGLSHDSLIRFSKVIIDKFPIIRKRIASKYQLIFIDEYQDTSADVLRLFYDCVQNSNTNLYLFGDRMQQIYNNYDGSFENKLKYFNRSLQLKTNFRSSTTIIKLLNNICNDTDNEQKTPENKKDITQDIQPKVIICDDVNTKREELQKTGEDFLVLYLLNRERFSKIGTEDLFSAFTNMENYKFGKKNSVVDVLTSHYTDNPDILMKLLFLIVNLSDNYDKKHYGFIIQKMKKYHKIFDPEAWNIKKHTDKLKLRERLEKAFSILKSKGSIDQLLNILCVNSIIRKDYIEKIKEENEYKKVLNVSISKVILLNDYLNNPKVSTQHGVKGESHNNVIFVADDNANLSVNMYDFLKFWSEINLSLKHFQKLYSPYFIAIKELEKKFNCKVTDLKKESFAKHKDLLVEKAKEYQNIFGKNDIWSKIYTEKYDSFLKKPNVDNSKSCFTTKPLESIFQAYKLFYVGCSRARSQLIILLERKKMGNNIEIEKQKEKFEKIGFIISEAEKNM
ncbi:UvrD-helicase domain-containing protein [Bartonella sp. A05]|uniref:UvrD-helicase domain-containing protein n=1 Tax=Bartonella sp. A05 TaxID=2967261 RepID=UPI0022A9B93B|nr:UvrD-helicase domain-containing protein [Bartonella sp. A05]MCZ2203936.1 AAA family ATPase [Bartonella sp. A05]